MTQLARITVYPIKSLDGVDLPSASILPSGVLENDRRFALVDAQGRYINSKRTEKVHAVRAQYRLNRLQVWLWLGRSPLHMFSLINHRRQIASWLSESLGQPATFVENDTHGMPDDPDAPGPTLISTQSLEAMAGWFGLEVVEVRRRMRANLEIDAPHAFWEDQLVGHAFSVGGVTLRAAGVCQRCVAPARDSRTGVATPGFQKHFAKLREQTLPAESPRDAFDHFYRVAINTALGGQPGELSVGDAISWS